MLATSSTIAIPGGGFDPEVWNIEAGGAWGSGGGGVAGGTRGGGGAGGAGSSSKVFMPLPVGLNSGRRLTTPQGGRRQVRQHSPDCCMHTCLIFRTYVADGETGEFWGRGSSAPLLTLWFRYFNEKAPWPTSVLRNINACSIFPRVSAGPFGTSTRQKCQKYLTITASATRTSLGDASDCNVGRWTARAQNMVILVLLHVLHGRLIKKSHSFSFFFGAVHESRKAYLVSPLLPPTPFPQDAIPL